MSIDAQTQQDYDSWTQANQLIGQDNKDLATLCDPSNTTDPFTLTIEMLYQISIGMEDTLYAFAQTDAVETDLLSQVGEMNTDIDTMMSDAGSSTDEGDWDESVAAATDLTTTVDQFNSFLEQQQALGDNAMFDQASISSMLDATNSIKDAFGTAWPDPQAMTEEMQGWNTTSQNEGSYCPQQKQLQDATDQLSQSLSGEQTATSADMQNMSNLLQSVYATMKSATDEESKASANCVKNQVSQ